MSAVLACSAFLNAALALSSQNMLPARISWRWSCLVGCAHVSLGQPTSQVEFCQCCVCLECIAQSTRSFNTNPVVCQSLHVPLCSPLSRCASLWFCCSPLKSSIVSVVFVSSASPSPRAPSARILLTDQSHPCHCACLALVVLPCGLAAHCPGPVLSVLCLF